MIFGSFEHDRSMATGYADEDPEAGCSQRAPLNMVN